MATENALNQRHPPMPVTSTATSHGISIIIPGEPDPIGMIQTWAPAMTRTVNAAYELNPASSGEVVEQIPANLGGLVITITRYDLFKKRLEQVFGFTNYENYSGMLTDQFNPITINEKLVSPDNSSETISYRGCWFTNLGRNLSSQGDRIINVNASLAYTRKIPV